MDLPPKLTPADKNSFAYETVKDRIPRIIVKVIDTCNRDIKLAKEKYGEDGAEDMKKIIGKLSKLRSEIMTDKPVNFLEDNSTDTEAWNKFIESLKKNSHDGNIPSWFSESWMFLECFVYRVIMSTFFTSCYFKDYDPFQTQKNEGLQHSLPTFKILLEYLDKIFATEMTDDNRKSNFLSMLLISLWGNKFDLSLSGGINKHTYDSDPVTKIHSLDDFVLVNEYENAYGILRNRSSTRIDMVIDNAGFELCSDLILAEYLISANLTKSVCFHPKIMPWFVSDVTYPNFHDTIGQLVKNSDKVISKYGNKWQMRLKDGTFALANEGHIEKSMFWTLPYTYNEMKEIDNDMHVYLTKSDLIIFKGDLNYRKLVGDRNWSPETSFKDALRGFRPAPLISLRTLKADVVVGLKPGQAEKAKSQHDDWLISGNYAVISFL